jgi:hypothetical protein
MVMFLLGGLSVLIVQAIGIGVMIWVSGDDKETLPASDQTVGFPLCAPIDGGDIVARPGYPEDRVCQPNSLAIEGDKVGRTITVADYDDHVGGEGAAALSTGRSTQKEFAE